jgi:uncharacterized RDD family membrane protein YckC
MSRWRDVKQGRESCLKQKTKPLPQFTISSVPDRLKAFITDTFMILMPLMYIVFYLIMGSREEFAKHMLLGWIYIFIPHFFFILGFWFFKGQTPGYKAYNIKLVNKELQRPTLFQLILRYCIFFLSIFFPAGLLFCFMRKDKKNMHDIFSGTMPIKIEA